MSHRVDIQARLRLRRGVVLAPADTGRWQARFDFDGVSLLEGEACRAVLPWLSARLDGTRTVNDLQRSPDCPCTSEQLQEVLSTLSQHGYVLDARMDVCNEAPSRQIATATEALGVDAKEAMDKVQTAHLTVCGRSQLAEMIVESLRQHGFKGPQRCADDLNVARSSSQEELGVVVETDFTATQLIDFNHQAIDSGKTWMLVGAWNRRVLVGPIFLPGETACYECYRRRLDSHRRHLAASQALEAWKQQLARRPDDANVPVLPCIAQLAAAWTSLELFSYVSAARGVRTLGSVLVYEPDSARLTTERVLRVPWCSACAPYTVEATYGDQAR